MGDIAKPPAKAYVRQARNFRDQLEYTGMLRNPENIPLSTYGRMFDTDETVRAMVNFLALGVGTALGTYVNTESKKAQKYVDEMFSPDGARVGLAQIVDEMCHAYVYGFAVGEFSLFADDKIRLDTVTFLKQPTVEFLMQTDKKARDYGEPVAVRQAGVLSDPISLQKCLHFVHGGRNGNPYGVACLKAAFGPWFHKAAVTGDWAKGLQRVGTPTPIGKVENPDEVVVDQDGVSSTSGSVMLAILDGLQNSSSTVVATGQEIDFLQPEADFSAGFKLFDDQQNKKILRSGNIPALLFEPTDIGSFALGSKHFEQYIRFTRHQAGYLERCLLRQLIGPLLRWNFGPNVPLGSFVSQKMDEEELKLWAEILYSLVQAGFLHPRQQDDLDFARAKLGVKLVKVDDMPPWEPKGAAGKDGQPGKAPDGKDDAGSAPPRGGSRTPGQDQGRPVGAGANGKAAA